MMKIGDLFEGNDDHLHANQLAKTGFWGAKGAGCLFFAMDTKRFLIAHRSAHVQEPLTWGSWGGAIDRNQSPEDAVHMEAGEEAGYHGPLKLVPLLVFQAKGGGKVVFQYHNFLALVSGEFHPTLNWETEGYKWCNWGEWPHPLHPGMRALLKDARSVKIMEAAARASDS